MLKTERVGAGVKTGGAATGLAGTGMVIAGNMLGLFFLCYKKLRADAAFPKLKIIVNLLRRKFSATK